MKIKISSDLTHGAIYTSGQAMTQLNAAENNLDEGEVRTLLLEQGYDHFNPSVYRIECSKIRAWKEQLESGSITFHQYLDKKRAYYERELSVTRL